jgi:hypothetical protein
MAPTPAYDPIPDWLRETRLSEKRADGKPWTQADLIAAMQAEIGWAPHRPNYSRYENGRSKPEDTLPRFIEFWARRGKPGPDYTPPKAPVAADPVADAIREQTKVIRLFVEETRLARVAQETTAQAVAEMVGRLDRFLDFAGTRDGDGQPVRAGNR